MTEQPQPEEQQQVEPSPAFLEGFVEGQLLRRIYDLEEAEEEEQS
jgi:hypothetical protein